MRKIFKATLFLVILVDFSVYAAGVQQLVNREPVTGQKRAVLSRLHELYEKHEGTLILVLTTGVLGSVHEI